MNSSRVGLKLKGFTLIEMLIVITIIAVLAGISSLAISGFQRNAKIETSNNKAQMVYTGFQNMVVQCEIKNDYSMFDVAKKNTAPDYVNVKFFISEATMSDIRVNAKYSDGTDKTVALMTDGSTDTELVEKYTDLKKAILDNIDSSFEGSANVFIDYKDFTVDSVVYSDKKLKIESGSVATDGSFDNLMAYTYKWAGDSSIGSFEGFKNGSVQKEYVKYNSLYTGSYPMLDSVGSTNETAKSSSPSAPEEAS